MVAKKSKKDILNFFVEMAEEQMKFEVLNKEELVDFLIDSGCEDNMAKDISDILSHKLQD